MSHQKSVEVRKARNDVIYVVAGIDGGPIQGWAIAGAGDRHPPSRESHLVGAGVFPIRNTERRHLARCSAETTQIKVLGRGRRPSHRQQADAQYRAGDGGGIRLLIQLRHRASRLKHRFQVDQYRVLTGRDQIGAVEVCPLENIEEGQQRALPLVETADGGD